MPLFVPVFLVALASAALAAFAVWRSFSRRQPPAAPPLPAQGRWSARLLEALLHLGVLAPAAAGEDPTLRARLAAAGFRHPSALPVFQGLRFLTGALSAALLAWISASGARGAAGNALAAIAGFGIGMLLPRFILEALIQSRIQRIHAAMPAALDLMVLGVEAGQSLDGAISETARELRNVFPELASEFWQVQLELRAGRPRADVLAALGQRTGSTELRKLAAILIDSDRFGTSLAPALRTHARYLRTRRRQSAQEAARKLTVKLIFPVFFLIMPAVLVVTLAPAVFTMQETLSSLFGR